MQKTCSSCPQPQFHPLQRVSRGECRGAGRGWPGRSPGSPLLRRPTNPQRRLLQLRPLTGRVSLVVAIQAKVLLLVPVPLLHPGKKRKEAKSWCKKDQAELAETQDLEKCGPSPPGEHVATQLGTIAPWDPSRGPVRWASFLHLTDEETEVSKGDVTNQVPSS